MKKIKLVLFSMFFIFFLTGCDASYDVEIRKSKINEQFSFTVDSTLEDDSIIETLEYYTYGEKNGYKINISKDDNYKKVTISKNNIDISKYFTNKDSIINTCYKNVKYLNEDNKRYIGSSKGFNCLTYDYMELDNFTIKIKTFYKVYNDNADKKGFHTYTWNIGRDDISSSNFLFVFSENQYVWYYKYRHLFFGLLIVGSLVLVGYLTTIIFKYFSKRSNKF